MGREDFNTEVTEEEHRGHGEEEEGDGARSEEPALTNRGWAPLKIRGNVAE